MTNPEIRIHDTETGEIIDREMTDEELAQYEAELAARATEETAMKAKKATKLAVLEKLGLTEEEASALLA